MSDTMVDVNGAQVPLEEDYLAQASRLAEAHLTACWAARS